MAATAQGLCEFIDASPSPFHVCETVASRLRAAGFTELAEADEWPPAGKFFIVRAGSPVAWDGSQRAGASTFRVDRRPHRQPQPAGQAASRPRGRRLADGCAGALRRCLAELVAGPRPGHQRTAVGARRRRHAHRLVRIDDPILRVPQLAIHLADDRKSLTLDPQRHVNAVWAGRLRDTVISRLCLPNRPVSTLSMCSAST